MKTILLILITLSTVTFAFTLPTKYEEKVAVVKKDPALCKLFNDKALAYEKTMRKDEYAQKTLESYHQRASLYCVK